VISIVDPEEFKHVLRPTVYAAAIEAASSQRISGRDSAAGSPQREPRAKTDAQKAPVTSSQID
jgi:hypothetical protein